MWDVDDNDMRDVMSNIEAELGLEVADDVSNSIDFLDYECVDW